MRAVMFITFLSGLLLTGVVIDYKYKPVAHIVHLGIDGGKRSMPEDGHASTFILAPLYAVGMRDIACQKA